MRLLEIIILVLTLNLISCGHSGIIKPSKKPQTTKTQELEARYLQNLDKLTGWPSSTDCDATLWAGIAKAGGVDLDITASKAPTGQWFRRPNQDCYITGSSRSDFSNDMALGIILSASDASLKHWYGWVVKNNYRMGNGDPGATILKPNVRAVLGRKLGINLGPRLPYVRNDKDYVRHIQTLMIYVDGRSTGYITAHELKLLESYDDGRDYLILAMIARYTGKYDKVINLLLAEGSPPTYVRGDEPERYRLAHWLFAASIILETK